MTQYNHNKSIGIIGLGLLGTAIAKRLTVSGIPVFGYDCNPNAGIYLANPGVNVVENSNEIAKQCTTILLCVFSSSDVMNVLWGDNGIVSNVGSDCLIIDMTTSAPQATLYHATRLGEKNIRFIDCPMMGNSSEIAAGKGVSLLGDSIDRAAEYIDLIHTFSAQIYYFDEVSHGHAAKLAINLMLGLHRVVLGEGLGFAKKLGLDIATVLEASKVSSACSEVMHCQGERLVNRHYENPSARLEQHWKDVNLILKEADRLGARVPLSTLHNNLMQEAHQLGWGELDNIAIAELFFKFND